MKNVAIIGRNKTRDLLNKFKEQSDTKALKTDFAIERNKEGAGFEIFVDISKSRNKN